MTKQAHAQELQQGLNQSLNHVGNLINCGRGEHTKGKGRQKRTERMSMEINHHCKDCPFFCSSWKNMMKHTFQCHSGTPNFSFQCGFHGCIQNFRTYSAMASHLQRKHPNWDSESFHDQDFDIDSFNVFQPEEIGGPSTDSSPPHAETMTNKLLAAQRSTALLLLTLKERYRVTQTAIDYTLSQIKQTVVLLMEDVKESVKRVVKDKAAIDATVIDGCFDDVDIFEGLGTEHMQLKFYQKHFNLVVCYWAGEAVRMGKLHLIR